MINKLASPALLRELEEEQARIIANLAARGEGLPLEDSAPMLYTVLTSAGEAIELGEDYREVARPALVMGAALLITIINDMDNGARPALQGSN